ncbi:hypothetical protein [Lactobacillus sp. LL6]|uniref:hypothetical protein n=1 Tax=Lactobacillus sp. LL6 TaxID=2596827 RepID=UPI00118680D3|nr:hypothetical protein [Lactobacillus sp. LL6]TSO26350.1 hypothetical protein FOD82_04595 [Lactobacillus sp. LL6]
MNYKKILLLFVIFLSLLGIGAVLSNVQSREANQLLEAHGLSNNTRYININNKQNIGEFLQYLNKTFHNKKIQLHLDNKIQKNQVLVWANHSVITVPTETGRYFVPDDFKGQVSFAILGPDTKIKTLHAQGNSYVLWNKRYYSVIGNLKHYHQMDQTKYYLSTGINQPTAQERIKNYQIVIDSNTKVINQIAKHYHVSVHTPEFVKKHQIHRLSVINEILMIIGYWLVIAICNMILALVNWRQARRTNLRDNLMKIWLINRSLRLLLIEGIVTLAAYIFLCWRAFFSKTDHLVELLILSFIAMILSYGLEIIILKRRENISA